jgi:hypothetical protein
MTGRGQMWGAGITLLLLSATVPGGGLETATLVATALLLAVYASQALIVPALALVSVSAVGTAVPTSPAPTRFSPDAPGRPQQPRAPTGGNPAVRPR